MQIKYEETDDPLIADHRNFYIEKWTKDGSKVDHMLYAGSNLDKARSLVPVRHCAKTRGEAGMSA